MTSYVTRLSFNLTKLIDHLKEHVETTSTAKNFFTKVIWLKRYDSQFSKNSNKMAGNSNFKLSEFTLSLFLQLPARIVCSA